MRDEAINYSFENVLGNAEYLYDTMEYVRKLKDVKNPVPLLCTMMEAVATTHGRDPKEFSQYIADLVASEEGNYLPADAWM